MLTSVYNWYYYDRVPNVEEVAEISRLHNELAAVPDERRKQREKKSEEKNRSNGCKKTYKENKKKEKRIRMDD